MAATEPVCILSNSWETAFRSTPRRLSVVLSGGYASAGLRRGTPAHTPRRDVPFFWAPWQPVLGSLWSPVPGCLPW